ncbi:peptidylprolyl isomerase, partial [uncultured Hymenobacter sp.]|uniref:peptidylprolyl isomerase n=1 Tax=uncultured Hymenobacter sp. TaxID=170016 RepID=UPI0035CC62D1
RQIYTAQDERNTAALLPFLTNQSATYRREAAQALASVQDKKAVPALAPLLKDAAAPVRRAAAYALGQTGDSTAVNYLLLQLLSEPDFGARRAAHEALGRCVSRRMLPLLWRTTATPDTVLSAGLAWGLARAALRGLVSEESMAQAASVLERPGLPADTRLGAATALARSRGLDSALAKVAGPVLLRTAHEDPDYAVRTACAVTLGRLSNRTAVVNELRHLASNDPDFRVRIAALRSLPGAPFGPGANFAHAALRRQSGQEALSGAEWFLKNGAGQSAAILEEVPYAEHWRARAVLLAAALRHAPPTGRAGLRNIIEEHYANAKSDYECGQLLQTLSEDAGAFDFILKQTFAARPRPVVGGYGLAALVAARGQADFSAARQPAFEAALRQALAGGDVQQLSTAAEAFINPKLVPTPQPADLTALRQARDELRLPRDIEAWQALQLTLDKLENAAVPTPPPVGKASQHPISWAVVQSITQNQRVRLRTTQGDIILQLKVEDAPGATASFVSLLRQKFYDGLYFHRVVPGFVAQGGDPRGDGAGSAPYTLRSELPELRYGEGAVGLASAGKDTESCQFFITHNPTPHLDGRYPIFAQVVQGISVVQKLEVGDRMLKVELVK